MHRAQPIRLILALTLALAAVALGGVSVLRKVESFQPLGFAVAAAERASGVVEVESVDDPRSALQPGDQILLANGSEVGGPSLLAERLRKEPRTGLVVFRGGELIQVPFERPPLDLDLPYLILAFIGVIYLLIGLFTLLRQGGAPGFLFFVWCLTSAAFYLLSPVPPVDLAYALVFLGDEAARILLPALTLHLFLVFPTPLGRRPRRWVPFLYLPAAALLALQADLVATGGEWIFGTPTAARLEALDRVEMGHLLLFALASVAVLAWRLARRPGWEPQRQVTWVAVGMAGGYLPFLALHGLPFLAGIRGPEALRAAAVLPLALVPLTFAYAILRYKLWDIEVIVRDTISMTTTLLLGIIGFAMVNLAINRGISQELALARNLLSFVAGLGIAGLLVPTRAGLSSALERLQYRGSFGKRRALSGLGRELLHERDLGRLCTALLRQMEEGVDLERTSLYLAQGGSLVALCREGGLPDRLAFDALGDEVWKRDVLRLSGLALPLETLSPAQQLFVAGFRYAFPLTVRGRGVGIALAGFKTGQVPLNSDDVELIRHLLSQAALAIENAQLLDQLQARLQEVQSLQRYNAGILESSPAGIAVLDEADRLVSANSAFAVIAGVPGVAGLAGRRLTELLPVSTLPTPGQGPVQVSFRDAAGRDRHLQVSLAVFEGDGEEEVETGGKSGPARRVLVVHDISERVALEAALQEQDRLAALGMLAAGVAHEVNTPITGISSYAQMLLSDTPEGHPHYEILKKVERQTFRASRIVNNLLELARSRPKERRAVAVAPLLEECVDLLGERLEKRRIEVCWELPEGSEPRVVGCEGELQQVFTNLVMNAVDAMSAVPATAQCPGRAAGGTLTLRVEADGEVLRVQVRDTGPGIPPESLETIFQPFYSTKLNRGGTGLGLSISREIVRRHGGRLEAESRPGAGACFTVELPPAPRSDTAA